MNKQNIDTETQDLLNRIGSNIRRFRKEKKMSQEDLAYSADINLTYLGYIENGKYNVSIGKLYVISKNLGVSLEEIIRFHEIIDSI